MKWSISSIGNFSHIWWIWKFNDACNKFKPSWKTFLIFFDQHIFLGSTKTCCCCYLSVINWPWNTEMITLQCGGDFFSAQNTAGQAAAAVSAFFSRQYYWFISVDIISRLWKGDLVSPSSLRKTDASGRKDTLLIVRGGKAYLKLHLIGYLQGDCSLAVTRHPVEEYQYFLSLMTS